MSTTVPVTMSAVVIDEVGGAEKLKYKTDVPVPEPKEDEVLIKTDYIGVNFIDTYFRTGLYKPSKLPFTLGVECSGTIVSFGPEKFKSKYNYTSTPSHNLELDSRVMAYAPGSGTYAAYVAAPIAKTYALPPQSTMTQEQAAATLIGGLTSLSFIREAYHVQRYDWVLVPAAAGGTGQWLCQLLKATGALVIGTASNEAKMEVARKAGATLVLDSSGGNEVLVEKVMKATRGEGVIAVFDGVGKATFETSMKCLARKGTMVTFGNASGPIPAIGPFILTPKNLKLCRPSLNGYIVTRKEFVKYCEDLLALVEMHQIPVNIHEIYPLQDAARAHQDLEGRKTTGKLLLKP